MTDLSLRLQAERGDGSASGGGGSARTFLDLRLYALAQQVRATHHISSLQKH